MITTIGVLASIGTGTSLVPQLIKVVREKKADGVSAIMLAVLITGNILWVYYGVLKDDWILISSSALSVLVNSALSILKFMYRKKTSKKK